LDFQNLFVTADAGDPVARQVLDHCLQVWSTLTVSLIHAYGPQVVVFGGQVLRRAPEILPRIREHVERYAWIPKGSVVIVEAELSSNAALYGALPLLSEPGQR
jgi:glucokinase